MVKKYNTLIDSSKIYESERDTDKSRRCDLNRTSSISLTDQSLAIPNVKLHPRQTTIESSSPSIFLFKSSLLNANSDIQDILLDKKHWHVSPKRIYQKPATCLFFCYVLIAIYE